MKKDQKTLHDHLAIVLNLLFIGYVIIMAAALFKNTSYFWILAILGFLTMIIGALYASKFYKCPHCGNKLYPRMMVPNFCPNCGKELN